MKRIILALLAVVMVGNAYAVDPIVTESTTDSTVTTNGSMSTTIKQPPPSAISPQFSSGSNSDLCTVGVAGAVQTQILGISAGTTFTEENCVRLKKAKTLYDMGMKVAAVSVMCTDKAVFESMMMAGTPCPFEGKIGAEAAIGWKSVEYRPWTMGSDGKFVEESQVDAKEAATVGGLGALGWLLLF